MTPSRTTCSQLCRWTATGKAEGERRPPPDHISAESARARAAERRPSLPRAARTLLVQPTLHFELEAARVTHVVGTILPALRCQLARQPRVLGSRRVWWCAPPVVEGLAHRAIANPMMYVRIWHHTRHVLVARRDKGSSACAQRRGTQRLGCGHSTAPPNASRRHAPPSNLAEPPQPTHRPAATAQCRPSPAVDSTPEERKSVTKRSTIPLVASTACVTCAVLHPAVPS